MLDIWIQAIRPRTLVAAIFPVAIGTSLAYDMGRFALLPAFLCLGFALLIQIGTNFANDYFDYKKGADTPNRIGPLRAVASGLVEPTTMLWAMIIVLILAFLTGLALLPHGGPLLLCVGIISLLCAFGYTGGPFPLAYLGLGDIFVVTFFGLVAVSFTFFVQAGIFTQDAWLAGMAIGLIINNLLVVNNYRDVEEDRRSSKRTLTVRFGRRFSLWQFWVQTFGAGLCTIFISALNNWFWLLAVIVLSFIGQRVTTMLQGAVTTLEYKECLANASLMTPVFGIMLCVGILL